MTHPEERSFPINELPGASGVCAVPAPGERGWRIRLIGQAVLWAFAGVLTLAGAVDMGRTDPLLGLVMAGFVILLFSRCGIGVFRALPRAFRRDGNRVQAVPKRD